ncbi:MAG: DUF192 domain-containing protein [bacterium]|nr:DUF192 domain-containing protein [bacterium]
MDIKKFAIQIVLLLVVAFGAMILSFNISLLGGLFPAFNTSKSFPSTQIKVGQAVVKVEVADTPEERGRGLGGRNSLATDSGMLFVFSESQKQRFWMKGMKIPVDMIFIDKGRVVDILKNVPPPSPNQSDQTLLIYEPVAPADMVLETNAGFADSFGIRTGDSVYLLK